MIRDSCTWAIAGTRTFRLGSRKILGQFGGNLQNIEKSMREIYIPDEGKIFVQTDQSGAEALIVAYLCEKGDYRKLFENRIKPHTFLGMHLFKEIWGKELRSRGIITADSGFDIRALINAPIDSLKSTPFWKELDLLIKDSDNWPIRYYYLAKQTEHSSNYDIQPPMFRMNVLEKSDGKISISKEDSERFLMTKFSLFPEIKDWHQRCIRQCKEGKILFNLHGHPYTITAYEILEGQKKEYLAWAPQSTVGEITNIAYAKMQSFIEQENLDWDCLVNCHDSIMSQCPIEEARACGLKQKEFIEQSFVSPVDGVWFQMRSETQIGFNWNVTKKNKQTGVVTNPMGLKELDI